jgi:aminopeptidase YwaD
MNKLQGFLLFLCTVVAFHARSQPIDQELRGYIEVLSSPEFAGRGYVKDGRELAARFVLKKFKKFNLLPLTPDSSYLQLFDFPVNTFPGRMDLAFNDEKLSTGRAFMIDASSSGFTKENLKLKKINLKKVSDSAGLREALADIDTSHAYLLKNVDDYCTNFNVRKDKFASLLPAGVFIIPTEDKLTWTVSREVSPATVFYVRAEDVPRKIKIVDVDVNSQFIPAARNENIIGYLPGEIKDTFIAFTAHYDHLGEMGRLTIFPGASDNASGTAMLLSLEKYFSTHPQHYSILFIAFAGEEAGLMGSEFYTWKPQVPLNQIKFLTNLDILGDATNGITVVNATKFPVEFSLLQQINEKGKYIPEIKSRGEAANSDHYYFSEAGVHSFFIYSNGGKGYYHDVYDDAFEVKLKNIAGVQKLLIDFVKELR